MASFIKNVYQNNSYLRSPFSDLLNENLLEGSNESVYFAIAHVILKIKLRFQPRSPWQPPGWCSFSWWLSPLVGKESVWVSLSQFSSFGQGAEHISIHFKQNSSHIWMTQSFLFLFFFLPYLSFRGQRGVGTLCWISCCTVSSFSQFDSFAYLGRFFLPWGFVIYPLSPNAIHLLLSFCLSLLTASCFPPTHLYHWFSNFGCTRIT